MRMKQKEKETAERRMNIGWHHPTSIGMSLSENSGDVTEDRGNWCAAVHGTKLPNLDPILHCLWLFLQRSQEYTDDPVLLAQALEASFLGRTAAAAAVTNIGTYSQIAGYGR